MKVTIIGSGVISLSYGWLLHQTHTVTHLVGGERKKWLSQGVTMQIEDTRSGHPSGTFHYQSNLETDSTQIQSDVALVTTGALQLPQIAPALQDLADQVDIIMMMNHWDLPKALSGILHPDTHLIGFPSQVGGGRKGHEVRVTVFLKVRCLDIRAQPKPFSLRNTIPCSRKPIFM